MPADKLPLFAHLVLTSQSQDEGYGNADIYNVFKCHGNLLNK